MRRLVLLLLLVAPCVWAQNPTPTGPAATGNPVCGLAATSAIHIPTDWATFAEPAMGGSYIDAVFGCQVTRLTNGGTMFGSPGHGIGVYYSTVTATNSDNSLVMGSLDNGSVLIIQNGLITGHFGVAVASGSTPGTQRNMWSRSNPLLFWYVSGNSLFSGTVTGTPACYATNNCTVTSTLVHQFTEYQSIGNMDETRVSLDGHHLLVEAQVTTGVTDDLAFLYDITALTKGAVFDSGCVGNITASTNQDACWHKMQIAGDSVGGGFVIGSNAVNYWNGSAQILLQNSGHTSHYDTGIDQSGTSTFVDVGGSGALTGQTNPCPSGQFGTGLNATGSIAIYPISNPTAAGTCILDSVPSWHIGWGGNQNEPWIMINFFQESGTGSNNPMVFGNAGGYSAPSSSNWGLYQGELILARSDANQTNRASNPKAYRLAWARSRSANSNFDSQVLGNVSFDGQYVTFNSDGAYGNTGCSTGITWHVTGVCTDIYIVSAPGGGGLFGSVVPPPWSGLIVPARATDWSNAGVLDPVSGLSEAKGGGIPHYPTGAGTTTTVAAYGQNNSGTVTSNVATMAVNTVTGGTNVSSSWTNTNANLVTLTEGSSFGTYAGQGCPCTFTWTGGDPFNAGPTPTTGDWVGKTYWITTAGTPRSAVINAVSGANGVITFATQPISSGGSLNPNGSGQSVRTVGATISSVNVAAHTFTVSPTPTLAIGAYTFAGGGNVNAPLANGGLQPAINACSGTPGNGNVVLLGPGTFWLNTSPTFVGVHDCVLRGSGADQTTINATAAGTRCASFPAMVCIADQSVSTVPGAYPVTIAALQPGGINDATWTGAALTSTVTAGTYTPGSTWITLTNVGSAGGGIHNGQVLNLDQDDAAVTSSASGGYDFCMRLGYGSYNALGPGLATACNMEYPFSPRGGRHTGTVNLSGNVVTLATGSNFVTGGAWDNATISINSGPYSILPGSVNSGGTQLTLVAQTSGSGAPSAGACNATGTTLSTTYLDTTGNVLYVCAYPNPSSNAPHWSAVTNGGPYPYVVNVRSQTQVVNVVSIPGTCGAACTGAGPFTIQISDPLVGQNWSSTLAPAAWFPTSRSANGSGYNVGVEDMTLDQQFLAVDTNTSVGFVNVNNAWMKGVRSLHGARNHNIVLYSDHISLENNYYYGTQSAATQSYALESDSSASVLFENNICQQIVACMIVDGDTANVYAYNFGIDAFVGNAAPATLTSTVLSGGVATYTYTGTSQAFPSNPISVAGSTNGSGIFNVTNAPLNSINTTGFTILVANLPCNPSCPASVGLATDTGIVHSSNSVMSSLYITHSEANRYDLIEGNIGQQFQNDNFHGPARTQTAYRNYFGGYEKNITQQNVAFRFASINRYINMLGNVLGSTHSNGYNNYPTCSGCGSGPAFIYSWITFQVPDSQPSWLDPDTFSQSTSYRWGNYDIINGTAFRFNAGEVPTADAFGYAQTVPTCATVSCMPISFWRTTNPSFNSTQFGVVPWPTIGPNVTGGNAMAPDMTYTTTPPGGFAFDNAASKVWQNAPIDPNYIGFDGGVRLFNENMYTPGAATPTASLTPNPLAFGNQNINTTSTAMNATFQNTSTVNVVVSGITVTGHFTHSGGTCTTSTTLTPGQNCTIGVTFSPNATGLFTNTLTVTSNAAGSPQFINLTGTGTQSTINWSSPQGGTAYNFGSIPVSSSINSASLTLQNTGTGPLTVSVASSDSHFVIFSTTCTNPLAAGSSCVYVVTFTPTSATTFTGNLTETDSNASNSPQSLAMSGSGFIPVVNPVVQWPPIILQ